MALFSCYSGLEQQDLFSAIKDSMGNTRKTASGNYCKTLSAIQRSDQKLWPFSAVIPVWRDKTSSSTSRDSMGSTRKMDSENYCKNIEPHPTVRSKAMALFRCYCGLA